MTDVLTPQEALAQNKKYGKKKGDRVANPINKKWREEKGEIEEDILEFVAEKINNPTRNNILRASHISTRHKAKYGEKGMTHHSLKVLIGHYLSDAVWAKDHPMWKNYEIDVDDFRALHADLLDDSGSP